ncbi:unnamed protein product [Lepeophtheirus salmonis]|uniref:(salmon louse) hypothetical protein n=1 Tax=Lepeophtheirus salmonis TaxID=72036 RepID=A0A7R8HD60_LEPSM|nr:unnamed protein product [Lepeophtheirus salmonis]CAF3016880.1 unnamed protein product [Lepeophtheirus salmonis]
MSEAAEDPREEENFDDLYESSAGNEKGELKRGYPLECDHSLLSLDEQVELKKIKSMPESLTQLKPLPEEESKSGKSHENASKIYVGGLPANLSEGPLGEYFSVFGEIQDLVLVRDYATRISKGYAFITFREEAYALNALKAPSHNLENCHSMRVSPATSKSDPDSKKVSLPPTEDIILPDQKRIYIGPLFENISNEDIRLELKSYGNVKAITRHPKTTHHQGYCAIEFTESISLRRIFGQKISLGNISRIKVTCSRFIIELLLSPNVVFFHEAYLKCEHIHLEKYFTQFGKVFRTMQFYDSYKTRFKSFGFVDYVDSAAVDRTMENRSQLIYPGQFVRVTKYLPAHLLLNMSAIGDKDAQSVLRSLEPIIPESGIWGESASKFNLTHKKDEVVSSQVRFPAKLVPK